MPHLECLNAGTKKEKEEVQNLLALQSEGGMMLHRAASLFRFVPLANIDVVIYSV